MRPVWCTTCGRRIEAPSDPQPARLETVAQLARDILTAIESHDTHRMRHIEQYALRIIRVAEGTQT